jgi:ribosomal-protein-alanine N-acetyltransferase
MVRVRPAVYDDLPRLIEIAGHSVTAAQWKQDDYLRLFVPESQQARTALVIEQDGEQDGGVMGFIVGRKVDHEWEIENVAVTSPARRNGLGSRLLGEFLNMVREHGGSHVFLEVRVSNTPARALYEKWAFVESGRRKSYYDGPVEDALILRFSFPRQDTNGPQ